MRPKTRLKNMRINEVSLVDRPANEHARILFTKRNQEKYAEWAEALGMSVEDLAKRAGVDVERHAEKQAEYDRLAAYVKKYPWDAYMRQRLADFWPRIDDEPKKVKPMDITKNDEPPVMNAAERVNLSNLTLNALAHQVGKANPHLTAAQAFEKAYKENPHLARMERNASYEAIGASYRISDPVNKSQTDGTDISKRVASLVAGGMDRKTAFDKAASEFYRKAALPEMMDLRSRTLGDYATGSRSVNQDLDTGWPSESEIARLYNDMLRAGRDGKNFDRAAAAYLASQQRIAAAARDSSGVRSLV